MSQDHDKQFFNTFGIVIAILVAITIVILIIATGIASKNVDADNRRNPYAQAQVVERIQPPGQVAVAGASAAGASGSGAAVAVSASSDDNLGQRTYQQACFACHGTGAAGAPKVGDVADWTARAAQGREILIRHSIDGYMGSKGYMPPKGGQTQLSDEAVIAALDYMVDNSK